MTQIMAVILAYIFVLVGLGGLVIYNYWQYRQATLLDTGDKDAQ